MYLFIYKLFHLFTVGDFEIISYDVNLYTWFILLFK